MLCGLMPGCKWDSMIRQPKINATRWGSPPTMHWPSSLRPSYNRTMHIIQAIILGITQGLTEFIPVSSSGHLIIVGHAIGFKQSSLGFDTALDIGTLAALLLFFRKDIL